MRSHRMERASLLGIYKGTRAEWNVRLHLQPWFSIWYFLHHGQELVPEILCKTRIARSHVLRVEHLLGVQIR